MKISRISLGSALTLATAGILLCLASGGCAPKDVAQTTDEVNEAPGVYGKAIDKAKDVSHKVEKKSSEGIDMKDTNTKN